jgi:hypothetical protein
MPGPTGALLDAPTISAEFAAEPPAEFPAAERVRRLALAGSELGEQLQRSMRRSLRSHLASLGRVSSAPNEHRERLARAVGRYLEDRGDRDVDTVCDHLMHTPVIQQADHSNLILDAETFLNGWLFHLSARETGATVAITSQCSTMSGLSRRAPVLGPTFLRTRGALLRVVPLSKTVLKDSSFCALPGPVPMTFEVLEGELDVAGDPVLGPLLGRVMHDAPRTYRAVNAEIWDRLDVDHGIRRVGLDEAVVAECVALHLDDPTSPVSQLLFDPQVRAAFLRAKRRLVASAENLTVNRAAPDFFWYRKGTRLREVVLEEAGWRIEDGGPQLPVPFEPRALAAALRAGELYADRVLAYLVRCILPGVVAVGGVSQQDYVRLYRRMLLETHAEVPFLTVAELAQVRRADLSRLGGRPLLEPVGEARELVRTLGPATPLGELERAYLDRPIGETIGELRCLSPGFERRILAATAPGACA